MIVRIDKNVHVQIAEFYAISMALHPTLDEVTVEKKRVVYTKLFVPSKNMQLYIPTRVTSKHGLTRVTKSLLQKIFILPIRYTR